MTIRAIKITTERNNRIDELEVGGPVLDPDESCQPDAPCVALVLRETGGPLPPNVTPGCFPISVLDVPTAGEGNLSRASDAISFGTPGAPATPGAALNDPGTVFDGAYGLNNSWQASGVGFVTAESYVGIYWEDSARSIEEIALGCDNMNEAPVCTPEGGQSGTLRVEWTADEDVDANEDGALDDEEVALASWECAGQAPVDVGNLRQRCAFPGGPVIARAVRVRVPVGARLDEVELGAPLDLSGRDGDNYPSLALIDNSIPAEVPGVADGNIAREGTAFASSSANEVSSPVSGINNGLYGTASGNSWFAFKRGTFSGEAYVGIEFPNDRVIEGIAIGGNSCTGDVSVCGTGGNAFGTQWVQYADEDFVASSDNSIANVNWMPVGKITASVLRQRYEFDEPVLATAVRVLVRAQPQGTGGDTVDELELYGNVALPTGACCAGCVVGNCFEGTQADCEAVGGGYQGDGTDCAPAPCIFGITFRRGDHDGSGLADITDALNLLGFLFLGTTPPICRDASDFDNSGALDITDALILLGHLFLGSPNALPTPGTANCGLDPTTVQPPIPPIPEQEANTLGCERYPGDAFPDACCP
jgi:hypothetical protein